jgi:hypothetical protein
VAARTGRLSAPKGQVQDDSYLLPGEPEGGPRSWLIPFLEASYSRIVPRSDLPPDADRAALESAAVAAAIKGRPPGPRRRAEEALPLRSTLQPGLGDEVLQDLPRDFWLRRLQEYQQRKSDAAEARAGRGPLAMPAIPGLNNWVPLGPAVAARGQAVGRPAISGRVSRMAVTAGGMRLYAATANGGIFRSDDSGSSWRSLMDGFDVNPLSFASTSLCCGAIAVSTTDADKVYVGTGEGDTDAKFTLRLTNALPSYRGIGPIRTDDGGTTWVAESSSPSLAGFGFYQLAVDPANDDTVVAATTNGLYQRVLSSSGVSWRRRRTGAHTTVVAARAAGVTTFYAAERAGLVYRSTDGATWTAVGTSFPTANVGRVALGVQPDNPNVLYAVVANGAGGLLGVYRLDGGSGPWKSIRGTPDLVPGKQGDYDLCIAVDPTNANRIYLGGDRTNSSPFPASIHRCIVSASGSAYSMTTASIGSAAHSDVHALDFVPGDPSRLWTGTDGGCFLNLDPAGSGVFEQRNVGLSSLCTNYIGMSASEPAVMFVGLQDNGTARSVGEELWRHVLSGDGGYCVVHPTDPFVALAYANGKVFRTATGGMDYADWGNAAVIAPPWGIMAEPLVGAPGSPRVAFGAFSSGNAPAIFVSEDFGQTWPATSAPTMTLPSGSGGIYSMVFASPTRLYIGTTAGRVFRADLSGGTWSLTRIDNATGGPLPLAGLISDLAVDWSDATLQSIYLCLGGVGDQRHVWRFDGTTWQARSGTGASSLVDVEHNAIVVDPANPTNVYVGADLGVWQSLDGGLTWVPLERGLPDAPVFDLQLHSAARLLRASTHGRGLYEYRLDPPALTGIELYVRDSFLDLGRGASTDGRSDPSVWPTRPVWHWRSPNIKLDVPTSSGYQTPTSQIDFFQFHEAIVDGSLGVATIDPPQVVHNRLYALVHNRGPLAASSVRVLAAVTNASTVLRPLPAGYTANIQTGTTLPGFDWTTLPTVTLTELRPGFPQVAAFDLPSNVLPLPASLPGQSHFCVVVFAHAADDVYTATEQNVDLLTVAERKVAQKNLHIVQFAGTPPPPEATAGMWARLEVGGHLFDDDGLIDLEFRLDRFPGRLSFVAPEELLPTVPRRKGFHALNAAIVKRWVDQHRGDAERLQWEGKYAKEDLDRLLRAMAMVADRRPVEVQASSTATLRKLAIAADAVHTIFLRIDPPPKAKVGEAWEFSIVQRDAVTGRVQGGADYSVRINRPQP